MRELYSIALDVLIPDNNTKVNRMIAAFDKYDIDYQELAPGTNRLALLIDGYVFKIGLDKAGIRDNWAELSLTQELQPFVIKVYECNGLINVSEYVTVISKTEFQESKEEVRQILSHLAQGYLLGDVGSVNKNFMNWGYREDGQLVILDFAYIYRVVGDEMMCGGLNKDDTICEEFLEYDENFHELICPKCRKKYTFHDIRRRIDMEFEQKELDMIKQTAYKVTQPHTDVEEMSKESVKNNNDNINKGDEEDMGKKNKNKVSVEIDYDPIEAYNEAVAFAANMYNGNNNCDSTENDIIDDIEIDIDHNKVDVNLDIVDVVDHEPDIDLEDNDYDNFDEDAYESTIVYTNQPIVDIGCDVEESESSDNVSDKDLISELINDPDDDYYPDDADDIEDAEEETEDDNIEVDEGCSTEDADDIEYEKTLLSDDVEIETDDYKEPIHISEEVPGINNEEVEGTDLIQTDEVLDVEPEKPSGGFQIFKPSKNVNTSCDVPQSSHPTGKMLILSESSNIDDMRNELMSDIDDYDDSYDDMYDDAFNINRQLRDSKRRKNN